MYEIKIMIESKGNELKVKTFTRPKLKESYEFQKDVLSDDEITDEMVEEFAAYVIVNELNKIVDDLSAD